jgi:hypothetical protein
MMKRFVSFAITCVFALGCVLAAGRDADATPAYEIPTAPTLSALDRLAADGVLDGYRRSTLTGDRPQTRAQVARIIARALAKARRHGSSSLSEDDRASLLRLVDGYADELTLLGVHVADARALLSGDQSSAPVARSFKVDG